MSKPKEWGNYIHPETFEIKEIAGDIPDNSIVVIQKREFRSEISRSVIITRYGFVSKGSLIYIAKSEVSKRLAKLCSKIMLKTNKIPPHTIVSEERTEDKPIKLIFNYSAKETFPFQITKELLDGQKPFQIIEKIIASSDKKFETQPSEKQWILGYAPHSRGLCKVCKKQIKEKELRFREMESRDSVLNPEVYHFHCFPFTKYDATSIHGIDKLKEEDQHKIKRKMKM